MKGGPGGLVYRGGERGGGKKKKKVVPIVYSKKGIFENPSFFSSQKAGLGGGGHWGPRDFFFWEPPRGLGHGVKKGENSEKQNFLGRVFRADGEKKSRFSGQKGGGGNCPGGCPTGL